MDYSLAVLLAILVSSLMIIRRQMRHRRRDREKSVLVVMRLALLMMISVPLSASPAHASTRNRRDGFQLLVTAGAAYNSRTFKSASSPTTVTGTGLVPAYGSLEIRYWRRGATGGGASTALAAGASFLAETAEPTTAGVNDVTLAVPLVRAWVALEKPLWGVVAGIGPYGTTSQNFSWSGTTPVATRQIALGVTGMLSSSQVAEQSWHWRLQVAYVCLGANGTDWGGYIRRFFGGSARAGNQSGLFWQGEGMMRSLNIETSYAAIVEIGNKF